MGLNYSNINVCCLLQCNLILLYSKNNKLKTDSGLKIFFKPFLENLLNPCKSKIEWPKRERKREKVRVKEREIEKKKRERKKDRQREKERQREGDTERENRETKIGRDIERERERERERNEALKAGD